MSYINDQASGLARPHVTGEGIHALSETHGASSSKSASQADTSSPSPAYVKVIEKYSERPSSLNKPKEDGIESDRMLRFHRKAER